MAFGSNAIDVHATPLECYRVITDFEAYPDFIREAGPTTILKQGKDAYEVEFTVTVIKSVVYTLKLKGIPGKSVSWTLLDGGRLMKKNEGCWRLKEMAQGQTNVYYQTDVELGLFIPAAISKALVGTNLPSMLASFKREIEKRHNKKKAG